MDESSTSEASKLLGSHHSRTSPDVDDVKVYRLLEPKTQGEDSSTSADALLDPSEENALSSIPQNSSFLFPSHFPPAEYDRTATEDVGLDNHRTNVPPTPPFQTPMSEAYDFAADAVDAETGCIQRPPGIDMFQFTMRSLPESNVNGYGEGKTRPDQSSPTELSYATKSDDGGVADSIGSISATDATSIPEGGISVSGKGRQGKAASDLNQGVTEATDQGGNDGKTTVTPAVGKAARIQRINNMPEISVPSSIHPSIDTRFRTVSSPLSQVFRARSPVTADFDEPEITPPGSTPELMSPATPVELLKRGFRDPKRSYSAPSTPSVKTFKESDAVESPRMDSSTHPVKFSILNGRESETPGPSLLHIPVSPSDANSPFTASFTLSPTTPVYSFQNSEYHNHSVPTSLKAEQDDLTSKQQSQEKRDSDLPVLMYSLWDYLKEEITTTEMEVQNDIKGERVTNFLDVPGDFEKLMLFGYVVCLDAFLYIFTILPIRLVFAVLACGRRVLKRNRSLLGKAQICDLFQGIIFIATCALLEQVDASKLYHSIRGQAVIKLYVIFNVLEILDRLCCSFGQDILDSFYARISNDRESDAPASMAERNSIRLRFIPHFALAMGYVFAHSIVLFYQVVTLNVAINSHSNALLTLLLSNQFVEIKGSVFKKFERENLFQLSCSDIVERFQLSVFLTIITLRNLLELSASSSPLLPSSFPRFLPAYFSSVSVIESLIAPVAVVTLSELAVDWLKHAFITKFNGIRPSAYGRFVDVLCRDLVKAGSKVAEGDHGRPVESVNKRGITRSVSASAANDEGPPVGKEETSQPNPFAPVAWRGIYSRPSDEMLLGKTGDDSDGSLSRRGIRGQRNDALDAQESWAISERERQVREKNDSLTEDKYKANGKTGTDSDEKFNETANGSTQRVSYNAKEGSVPSSQRHTLVDQSRVVSRRIGFASMPLACLVIRVLSQTLRMVEFFAQNDDGGEEGIFTSSTSPATATPPVSNIHLTHIFLSVFATVSSVSNDYVLPLLQWTWTSFETFLLEHVPAEWAIWYTTLWSSIAGLYHWKPGWVKWMGFDKMETITGLMAAVEQWVSEKWNWATILEVGLWVLVAVVIYACLVSLKILVGIHLLNFAHRRLEGIMEREVTEEAVAKKEKEERDSERRRLHQEFSDRPGASGKDSVWMGSSGATPVTLDNIERYTLFKSRIP